MSDFALDLQFYMIKLLKMKVSLSDKQCDYTSYACCLLDASYTTYTLFQDALPTRVK